MEFETLFNNANEIYLDITNRIIELNNQRDVVVQLMKKLVTVQQEIDKEQDSDNKTHKINCTNCNDDLTYECFINEDMNEYCFNCVNKI